MATYIPPNSTVRLYSGIPDPVKEPLVFSSVANRDAYFQRHTLYSEVKCYYVRKTGRIKLELPKASVDRCNYMSWVNTDFENKPFYAMIMDSEYVNNKTTIISYMIDEWMTWGRSAYYSECAMEREGLSQADDATARDNPYTLSIPQLVTEEGLGVGELYERIYTSSDFSTAPANITGYVPYRYAFNTDNQDEPPHADSAVVRGNSLFCSIILSPINVANAPNIADFLNYFDSLLGAPIPISGGGYHLNWGTNEGGFYRPTAVCSFKIETGYENKLAQILDYLTLNNLKDNIVAIYTIPAWALCMAMGFYSDGNGGWQMTPPQHLADDDPRLVTITPPALPVGVYNPKLMSTPFKCLRVVDPEGNVKEYDPSLFSDMQSETPANRKIQFALITNFSGVPTVGLYPLKYKMAIRPVSRVDGDSTFYKYINFQEGMIYSAFPPCDYATDNYLAFLANNYANALSNETITAPARRATGMVSWGLSTASIFAGAGSSGTVHTQAIAESSVNDTVRGWQTDRKITDTYEPVTGGAPASSYASRGAGLLNGYYNGFDKGAGYLDALRTSPEQAYALGRGTEETIRFMPTSRRPFGGSQYVGGAKEGHSVYMLGSLMFFIYFSDLRVSILDDYDDYFTAVGMTSPLVHVPYVVRHLLGNQSPTVLPAYKALHGSDEEFQFFFTKTQDMHVTNVPRGACQYIEALFNGGARFINGDALVPSNQGQG